MTDPFQQSGRCCGGFGPRSAVWFFVLALIGLGLTRIAAADPAPGEIEILGFRSAHFGMTETALRAAIAKDFPAEIGSLAATPDPVQQTLVLDLRVPDLVPEGGAARIYYTLGMSSHRLIQITANWVLAQDPALTAAQLVHTGKILQNYFAHAGYPPEKRAFDRPLAKGGFLLFRGQDRHQHLTQLVLLGDERPPEQGHPALAATALILSYLADPAHPDIHSP